MRWLTRKSENYIPVHSFLRLLKTSYFQIRKKQVFLLKAPQNIVKLHDTRGEEGNFQFNQGEETDWQQATDDLTTDFLVIHRIFSLKKKKVLKQITMWK